MAELVKELQKSNILTAKTLNGGKQTVFYWMRNGTLKLRKNHLGYYAVDENELSEMIVSLKPEGKGYYNYQDRVN